MKTRQGKTDKDMQSMLNVLERLFDRVASLDRNVAKIANTSVARVRKSRRSDNQVRQLSLAMSTLQDDPLHNVLGATKYAFRKMNGYKSIKALYNALSRQWNLRK